MRIIASSYWKRIKLTCNNFNKFKLIIWKFEPGCYRIRYIYISKLYIKRRNVLEDLYFLPLLKFRLLYERARGRETSPLQSPLFIGVFAVLKEYFDIYVYRYFFCRPIPRPRSSRYRRWGPAAGQDAESNKLTAFAAKSDDGTSVLWAKVYTRDPPSSSIG